MPKLRSTDVASGLGKVVGKQGLDFMGGKSLAGLGAKYQRQHFFKMLKTHSDLSPEHQKMASELAAGSRYKTYATQKVKGFTQAVLRLGKAGKLPGYGIQSAALSHGATGIVKSMATTGGGDTEKLALQKKQQEQAELRRRMMMRRNQFDREREAERQAQVPAKPGMGGPPTPMAPLTSVSRLPQVEAQKKVSIGELQTEANPPQTSVGQPKDTVALTGSNAGAAAPTGAGRDIQAPATPAEASAVPGEKPAAKDDDDVQLPDPGKAEDMEI